MNTLYKYKSVSYDSLQNRTWLRRLSGPAGTLLFLLISLLITTQSFAQNELELSSGSFTTNPNGPNPNTTVTAATTITQALTLLQNTTGTTFRPYTTPITVSVSLSDQVYLAIVGGGGTTTSTGAGLSFGTSQGTTSKAAVPTTVYSLMSAVGSGTNAQFTSNPAGPSGTGIDVATNYAFTLFTAAEALPATSVSARNDFGTMTVTFSQPVTNPVLDFVGLGGQNGTEGFSTEFTLTSVGGPASVALSKLSGSNELVVSGNQINNQGSGGTLAAACGTGGACGSVLVTGTNITSLTFRVYLRGDGKGTSYTGTTVYTGDRWLLGVSLQSPFSLSGTVFDDADGLTNNTIDGTPINTTAGSTPSTPLYAYLTDASSATATILASALVSSSGTYSFSAANANPRVILSTTPPGSLTLAPAASLPTNWTTIAEGTAAGGDGTPDGTTSLTLTTASPTASNVNFAIDQRPSGTNYTAANQINPGGTTTVNVPTAAFTGTDPEDGTYAPGLTGRRVGLGPATNGTLYYNGTAVTSSTVISGFNPSLVTLDPADGVVTATFPYTVYDNALVPSATSNTISMPFSIGISGTIFDDANGLTDNLINGTATNAGGLFAILTNAASTSVLANAVVSSSGTYSFTGLNAGTYS
ncbi:MAG: hypothetical protein EOO39_17550, partial [Cytophagaceae bacterium]